MLDFATSGTLYPLMQHFTVFIAGPGQALISNFISLLFSSFRLRYDSYRQLTDGTSMLLAVLRVGTVRSLDHNLHRLAWNFSRLQRR